MQCSAETWIDREIMKQSGIQFKVKEPPKHRSIRREEYKQLISKYHDRHRYRLMFELLWNAGMRPIEVCWLHRNNFNEDFTYGVYKVAKPIKEVTKKGEIKIYKSRPLPIPKDLAKRISKYWEGIQFLSPYGYIFPTFVESRFRQYKFYMNPRILNKEMDKQRKEFKGRWLERNNDQTYCLNPRSFRVSWITRFGKKCKDIFKTAKAIGHTDPRTTATYFDPVDISEIRSFQNQQEVMIRVPEITMDQTLLTEYIKELATT